MDAHEEVIEVAHRIAGAIAQRDVTALRLLLAAGFVHRSHGGAASDIETFLRAIEQIPGEIRFVRLERIALDLSPRGALMTGIQHAQVMVEGQVVDDRRGFVDWFVQDAGRWRIQAAVDLPAPA